jgi:hypothetical protein
MRTKHAVPAAIVGAALALAGCGTAAAAHQPAQTSAQVPANPAVANVRGTTNIVIYSVNSDGPYFRAVLSGSIGDYGPAVAVYPDGKVDPEHDSELQLDLSRGTLRLNIAKLDQEFSRAIMPYPRYPATCSAYVSFTTRVPVVAGSGTGSYRGITGDFTLGVTADEALAGAGSGAGEPCTQVQRRLWEIIILGGPGTVSS